MSERMNNGGGGFIEWIKGKIYFVGKLFFIGGGSWLQLWAPLIINYKEVGVWFWDYK